jgi:hypothetical protein
VQYTSVAAQTWVSQTFPVYSDGRAGTALVTVQAGGVTVGTATVVFYGKVATISATANYTILYANGTGVATGSLTTATYSHLGQNFAIPTVNDDPALAVTAKDSAGNVVPLGVSSYSVTSSNPASFSSTLTCTGSTPTSSVDDGSSSLYSVGFGVGLGCLNSTAFTKSGDKGTLTLSYTNSDGTVVTATPISLTAGGKPNVATLVPDTTSYAPGQKGYFTLTATDASGNPTADDQNWSNFFAATPKVTGAFAFSTTAITQAQSTVGGTEKIYFYAPIGDGTWSVTGTTGSDFVAAGQGATITASVVVGSAQTAASQAAVDAANEATDAANAATDAANNAMDSADAAQQAALDAGDKADAALAAVTDLATKVSAIATQIASLSALVKKIAAKVKA